MTVQEWLGENNKLGIDIWNKKYRYNNESFDQWLDRVSGGNEEVRKLIEEKKFLFGGRILANRGLENEGRKTSLSNCFIAGTQVLTRNGYKNIEDIKKGEYVLSDDGYFHLVNETMQREYKGDLYKLSGVSLKNDIYCTPNHQFLTNHGWKRADRILTHNKQVHCQDKIKIAQLNENVFRDRGLEPTIDISYGYPEDDHERLRFLDGGKVVVETFVKNRGKLTWSITKNNIINREIPMDKDFAYFIGRWLGDGSVTTRKGQRNPSILQIVFNATKERKDFERCKSIGERYFGISASVSETNQNVLALRFENKIISTWFLNNFGEKCDGKFVPNKYLGNLDMAIGLCDADGSLNSHGAFRIVLKNINLTQWLRETLYLNGINAGSIKETKRQDNTYEFRVSVAESNAKLNPLLHKEYHDKRHNIIANGDYEYAQLSSVEIVENYDGFVYNLSVEDTHNYTVEGVIAHNCYVISPPGDSIEEIFECASKLARTFSYGGGCGIDISNLAPRGAKVRNAAETTTGSVSFMDLYSMITGLIGQNNRRGALMISISCEHPDLEEFIGVKSDLDRVTKANISVRITDKFMAAVKNKQPFTLNFTRVETGETITKTIDAYEMFHKLCEMNWDYAEPGMLFWDKIENYNLLSEDKDFEYAGVNPCFSGDMALLTVDGYKTFEELCGTEPYIYNVNGNVSKSKVWCSGEKDTVIVKLGTEEIVCTPDHRFMTIEGEECRAKDLKGKRLMPCTMVNKEFDKRYVKYGFIQGDGQLTRLQSERHHGIEVNIGEKDTDIFELFSNESYTEKSHRVIYVDGFRDDLINLGFSQEALPNRTFPSTYNSWTKLQKASFLHGCYSANGSVIKKGRISYKTTCYDFAKQLCNTLEHDFNIQGVYITKNKAHNVKFANGEYVCRESYDVNIGQFKEITKFISEINFYQQYKREQLAQMMKSKAKLVTNVIPNGKIKVYDFTEPERHWGIVEGHVVHNCA